MAMDTADQEIEPRRKGGPFQFWREVRAEARKVTWATRSEVIVSVTMVMIFTVAAARSPMKFSPTGPIFSAEQVAARIVECVRRPRAEVMIYRPARILVLLNAVAPGVVDRILGVYWKKVRDL